MGNFVRAVRVLYTQEEIVEMAQSAASKTDQIAGLKDDAKSEASRYRKEIKQLKAEADDLLKCIQVGAKSVDHEFSWRINVETETAELVDIDTGEVVETREAYPHELAPDGAADKTEGALATLPEDPEQLPLPGVA